MNTSVISHSDINKQATNTAVRWWKSMNPEKFSDYHAPTSYKARLRRCESSDAAMMTDGFRALWEALPESITASTSEKNIECWATIAIILAQVKKSSQNSLATAAGNKGDGDKSVVSELRFMQLQNAKTPDDFLRRLRRIIQQIKGQVSVEKLTTDISLWFNEYYSFKPNKAKNRIAVRWAMDYYQAASAKSKK